MRESVSKLINIFTGQSCKDELAKLKVSYNELEEKYKEKQRHIDRTNSYWKRKVYELSKGKKARA